MVAVGSGQERHQEKHLREMAVQERPENFTFVYEKIAGKPTIAVNGAFGGPNGTGTTVVAHLFVEHATVPSMITHAVNEDLSIDLVHGDAVKRGDVTREIQATIVLSPENAIELGRFLIEKAGLALKQRGRHGGQEGQ